MDRLMLMVACVACLIGFVFGVGTLMVISATMLSSRISQSEEQATQAVPMRWWELIRSRFE